ncbi:hypothetical protein [Sphingomonas sp.]|uniref:hypothetical protein n=1 Tax=Sphingomonas sp. TaxID=28214 RepID=UPI00286B53F9|nr:hypothetical protein [Sphingomonas sp.]
MSKLPFALGGAAFALAAIVAPGAPATAQNSGKVSEIIVYGTDPCPRSTDDEIVICARKDERERYRIPERFRQGGSIQSRQAWAVRARQFETVGATGVNSCSPVGPAGFTGCLGQLTRQAFEERRDQTTSDTTPRR